MCRNFSTSSASELKSASVLPRRSSTVEPYAFAKARFARLIHSTTTRPSGVEAAWTDGQKANYYPTSSCKFTTQDIFAVGLFLRTGKIDDIAFARSVPQDVAPYGLPRSTGYPVHVHQNPLCDLGNGVWFATIDDVWDLP